MGKVPTPEKDKERKRIFFLGGSAVVNGKEPLPLLVERQFHKSGNPVEVYNYGVVSSILTQDLSRIVHDLLAYQPDYIVFYHGFNEFMNPLTGDPRIGYPFNFRLQEENPLIEKDPRDLSLLKLLLLRSTIARDYFSRELEEYFLKNPQELIGNKFLSKEWEAELVDHYWNTLYRIQTIGEAFNFKVIVYFQPNIFSRLEEGLETNERYNILEVEKKDSFKRMAGMALADKRRKDFQFYDLSDFFLKDKESPFIDFVHINKEARKRISKEVFNHLNNKVKLD